MKHLSIVGKDFHTEEHALGFYTAGDRIKFWGGRGAFWGTLWGMLFGSAFFVIPVHGPIVVMGPLVSFLVEFLPVGLVSTIMWCWARRWFQPGGLRLSWRGILLEIARWPVVMWALVNVLFRVKRSYMITPKGVCCGPRLLRVYAPYIALTAAPLAAVWGYALRGETQLRGYYLLAFINAAWGTALLVTALSFEYRAIVARGVGGNAVERGTRTAILAAVSSLFVVVGLTAAVSWESFVSALR